MEGKFPNQIKNFQGYGKNQSPESRGIHQESAIPYNPGIFN